MRHPYISEKAIKEVGEILRSGNLSLFRGCPEGLGGGYWVQRLEELICEKFGARFTVAMNSATACLEVALRALEIDEKASVVVSPYSFVSSASCVLMVGAKPVFCDIEDSTFCIDIDTLPDGDYKAIIPVDLCGHPADYDKIRSLGIPIIEDAAQAIGGKYKGVYCGLLGDCGIFSFNQSKQVSTGEGGALLTNNKDIYRKARALRNHAEVSDPDLKMVGYNYRMNEIEACLAYNQLFYIEHNISLRQELCEYMTEHLRNIEGLIPPIAKEGCEHSYYTYAVKWQRKGDKETFQKKMIERGLYFGLGYVKPLYYLPVFHQTLKLPVVERMYNELMVTDQFRYPMTLKDCNRYIGGIKECLKRN